MHLRRGDEGDLSEHERQLLHHIPASAPGVPLGDVARHLALPNSSASVLVKDLARSAQVPASLLRGAVIRVFGKREVGQKLRESLERLDAWARAS
jgi:hypothetical protein